MKTLKFFAILSLALIFTGVNTVYSKSNNNNDRGPMNGIIKYVVYIHAPNQHLKLHEQVYVIMTDENGNAVARPQIFTPGIWTYAFTEAGPVTGVRIARLVLSGDRTYNEYPYPDIEKGTFSDGVTYSFNLYPVEQVPANGDLGQ